MWEDTDKERTKFFHKHKIKRNLKTEQKMGVGGEWREEGADHHNGRRDLQSNTTYRDTSGAGVARWPWNIAKHLFSPMPNFSLVSTHKNYLCGWRYGEIKESKLYSKNVPTEENNRWIWGVSEMKRSEALLSSFLPYLGLSSYHHIILPV